MGRYSLMERVSAFSVIALCKRMDVHKLSPRNVRFAFIEFLIIIASIVLLAARAQLPTVRPFPP